MSEGDHPDTTGVERTVPRAAETPKQGDGTPAVVAKRTETGEPDVTEIADLATAAGYRVVDAVTQVREEDAAFEFGEGKVETIADLVARTGAVVLIVDNRLGPYQVYNIGQRLPAGVSVLDRFTLILEIFGQRAKTRKAQLQVELAELRYELPRVDAKVSLAKRDEHPGFMGLGEYDESRKRDIKSQISRIETELAAIAETEANRRAERRRSGFELVALAGYTNAGKSTLLRRLASDVDIDENDGLHPDLEPTAASEDRLFTTLGTTTRRASMERNVIVTDTVGFISNLPHWLVESFKSTLEEVYQADLVLLVVDASEPVETIREKIVTCHDVLYERNEAPVLTVFNKIDRIDASGLEETLSALEDLAPNPVPVSARTGAGVDRLTDRIADALPPLEQERMLLPQSDEAMSLVSWLHDHTRVESVDYAPETVAITFEAHPAMVERARSKAGSLVVSAEPGSP